MTFTTVFAKDLDATALYKAVKLSPDGEIEKVLAEGWHGHNAAFGVRRLANTGLVLAVQSSFFTIDGLIQAVYCTETGALFNPGR
ncbi:MAG: hypothetical protein LBE35_00205 [Clostridiales bacterium]|jgi:hypothetical protein|nr:hypothetical protein [Clostridiales bacterium]